MSLLDGYFGLGADTNKVSPENQEDLSVSPELTLQMSDEELIALSAEWQKRWTVYSGTLKDIQDTNENYWMGEHAKGKEGAVDNLIFESLETFLPIATRAKAEPLVEAENSEAGRALATDVRKMCAYQADRLSLNLTIKQVARYWALYTVGVTKMGWSEKENDIDAHAVRPQKLVLDPDAYVENGVYHGEYIGEEKSDIASNLVLKFPNKKTAIEEAVKKQMGTKVKYHEWWHDEYVFWTYNKEVLGKAKNPHWNYDTTTQEQATDEMGNVLANPSTGMPQVQEVPIEGNNHFNAPAKPYVFLVVFTLGKHPHDDTGLIKQNIPLQDLVNKRLRQIDKNADSANGGLKVSGDYFTKEQGEDAADALRKGKTIWVPTGDVNAAVSRDTANPLPNFVYESLVDYRNELRNIFGTRGSTPQGTIKEQTLGGKQLISGQDSDRTGGGISVYLEQHLDNIFNWMVQLMYVYYDEPHTAAVIGAERATEYVTIQNSQLTEKLMVSVKDGSMLPTDPRSKRDEALELWAQEALDPITLFDRLEFPNPREAAKQLYLWKLDPIQLFPDLLQKQQEEQALMQQQEQAQLQEQQGREGEQMAQQADLQNAQAELQHINELEKASLKQPVS